MQSLEELLRRYGMNGPQAPSEGVGPPTSQETGVPQGFSDLYSGGLSGPSRVPEGFDPSPQMKAPKTILSDRNFERVAGESPTGVGDVLLDKAINPLFNKLGLSGVSRGLNKFADFAGDISTGLQGAAERGTMGAFAPKFQAGVSEAMTRRLQEAMAASQMQLNQAKMFEAMNPAANTPKAATDIGKLIQDHRAGIINDVQLQDGLNSITVANNKDRQDSTAALRGEYRKDTDGVRQSMLDLAKSKQLLAERNPISATAAFTSFIRSIDNSVVRPAEQAAYSSAGGLARRLDDEISKLSGKGPLSDATVNDLLSSIETLENELNGILTRTSDFYGGQAKSFGLNPGDVTGIPAAEQKNVDIGPTEAADPLASIRDVLPNLNQEQVSDLLTILEEALPDGN